MLTQKNLIVKKGLIALLPSNPSKFPIFIKTLSYHFYSLELQILSFYPHIFIQYNASFYLNSFKQVEAYLTVY